MTGGLDVEIAARSLDHLLAEQLEGPTALEPGTSAPARTIEGGPGWTVSARRALVLAVRRAPQALRDELGRLEQPLAAPAVQAVAADFAAGKLSRALDVADRYPCSPFAEEVGARVAELRAAGPHDVLDLASLSSPIREGPLSFAGIRVQADGQEALVAIDDDGNRVWDTTSRRATPATTTGCASWDRPASGSSRS